MGEYRGSSENQTKEEILLTTQFGISREQMFKFYKEFVKRLQANYFDYSATVKEFKKSKKMINYFACIGIKSVKGLIDNENIHRN